jgi:hypothetical protein
MIDFLKTTAKKTGGRDVLMRRLSGMLLKLRILMRLMKQSLRLRRKKSMPPEG